MTCIYSKFPEISLISSETDKDGYKYITEADKQRFYEDNKPDDVNLRYDYDKLIQEKERLKRDPWVREVKESFQSAPELASVMRSLGMAVDSFKYTPGIGQNMDEFLSKTLLL
jgi:hypothetical protein